MEELQLETACSGELNAFLRRAVFARSTVAWAAAEGRHGGVGGHTNALVREMVDKTHRFRHTYLPAEMNGCFSGVLGTFLHRAAADLAEAMHQDEDLVGLLDRAFGEWLVLPTVYDMLEYRIPHHMGPTAIEAFRRLSIRGELSEEFGMLEAAFCASTGLTMRKLLQRSAYSANFTALAGG